MSNLASQQAKDLRCYVTAAGFNYEATAKELGQTVGIKYIQIGSGELPADQSPVNRTEMVSSYGVDGRFPAKVYADPKNPGGYVAECTISAEHAINGQGYVLNEASAVLDNGVLFAYRRIAGDYKPVNQGEARSYIIRLRFVPSNAENISITIDPTVVFATSQDIDREIGNHSGLGDPHPQYQLSELSIITKVQTVQLSQLHIFSVHADISLQAVENGAWFVAKVHSAVDLTEGDCAFIAPTGEKINVNGVLHDRARIVVTGQEFRFYRINGEWCV